MKLQQIALLSVVALSLSTTLLRAQQTKQASFASDDPWSSARPGGHAPIGVMGDHYHGQGELMLSYRYMPMFMSGNLRSSDDISTTDIHENYMVAPTEMTMQMHMFGAMYGVTDWITLMVMGMYLDNSMDLQMRNGNAFTTGSSGFGDMALNAMVKLYNQNRHSLHANLRVNLPTGSIDETDDTPMMDNAPLAYPMQLGSGTVDPAFGLTYLGQAAKLSWGAQPFFTLRTGENDQDYALGNRFEFTAWGAWKSSNWLSISLRGQFLEIGEIDGADPRLNPDMAAPADPANTGRTQANLFIGANFYVPHGPYKDVRIAVEAGLPVLQDVEGIQMDQNALVNIGLQYTLFNKAH